MEAPRFSTRSRIKLIAAAGLGLTGATTLLRYASAEDGEVTYNEITIRAHDFTFELPESIPAGWTSVTLINDGHEPHHAQILSIPEGMTFDDIVNLFATEGDAAVAQLGFAGGPAAVDPGLSSQAVVELVEGNYLLTCFISSPDGVRHLVKGMIAPLTVTAPERETAPPVADASVEFIDFAFMMPAEFPAGVTVFEAVNNGVEPHELAFVRLQEGVTVDAIFAAEAADAPESGHEGHGSPVATEAPPFTIIGGLQAISPGVTGYAIVDLTPANYAAICFVPSAANGGAPHAMLGMVATFTVA